MLSAQAAVAAMTNDHTRAGGLFAVIGDRTEGDLQTSSMSTESRRQLLLGELMLASGRGELDRVVELGELLAAVDEPDDLAACALVVHGAALCFSGDLHHAEALLTRAADVAEQAKVPAVAVRARGMLTMIECARGRPAAASRQASAGVALARSTLNLRGDCPAALHLGTAHLAVLRGDLDAYSRAIRRLAPEWNYSQDKALRREDALLRATVLRLTDQPEQAWALLQAEPMADGPAGNAGPDARAVLLAEIMLDLGRPEEALELLPGGLRGDGAHPAQVARARIAYATDDLRTCQDLIRRIVTSSPPPRFPVLVDALLISGLVAQARGDEAGAVEAVSRALDLSAQDKVVSPFLHPGKGIIALVNRHSTLADRWPCPIQATVPALPRQRGPYVQGEVFEDLTEREASVLRWLTTNMSTSEIAAELCVSVNTVKTHIASIYRKLRAAKRREAVARAREPN